MNIKHNKIKNTGILFELLVRKIVSDGLEGKSDSFAVTVLKEHFHSKTELGKELQLYRAFFNTQKISETKAFNTLDLLLQKRKQLNETMLNTQKYLLIKEIKQHCDLKQFMAGRVPSYKVYASLYKLFESMVHEVDYADLDDVISSRFVVVEHLKGTLQEENVIKENAYVDILKNQTKEFRYLSYQILLEKFNEKYSILTDQQKLLLKEYINNKSDTEAFNKYIIAEADMLENDLRKYIRHVDDEVVRIKLKEVVSQLSLIRKRAVLKENYITAVLIAYEIVNEVKHLVTSRD
jgi:hypothetical protein